MASQFPGFSQHRKLVVFGTVFFVTALAFLLGTFLFPSVRGFLHTSAISTGLVSANVLSSEAPPVVLFQDVPSTHPNAEAIAYLKNQRILVGYPDGTFKPDNFVTRAELLKFLYDTQKVYPSPAVYRKCFKDVADDWFAPYVCYAKAKEIVHGYDDGTFGFDKSVKAVEALKIILSEYHVPLDDGSSFTDMKIDPKAWYSPFVWTSLKNNFATWETTVQSQKLPNLTSATLQEVLLTRGQLAGILYRFVK